MRVLRPFGTLAWPRFALVLESNVTFSVAGLLHRFCNIAPAAGDLLRSFAKRPEVLECARISNLAHSLPRSIAQMRVAHRAHCFALRFAFASFVIMLLATHDAAPAAVLAARWTVPALSFAAGTHGVLGFRKTIIITTVMGIAALDADTGKAIWSKANVSDPVVAGNTVYVNMSSSTTGDAALAALDVGTGRQVWLRSRAGGTLAADDDGVVVGNRRGITRLRATGTPRWMLAQGIQASQHILVNKRYVVALSVQNGAILNGRIESIDRRTGRLIGSQGYFGFGQALDLNAHSALGVSDFPSNFDTWCGDVELLEVSLDPPPANNNGALIENRRDYVLEDIAVPTPPPGSNGFQSSTPCVGARSRPPSIILDGPHVVLASGPLLGVFDRTAAQPFARYRDLTLVGGPFAGRLYVARPHGLDALEIRGGHTLRFEPLISGSRVPFSVAGLASRLYVSNGKATFAFDSRTLRKEAEYGFGCSQMTAIVRTKQVDVLQCDDANGSSRVVAVPH